MDKPFDEKRLRWRSTKFRVLKMAILDPLPYILILNVTQFQKLKMTTVGSLYS